MSIDDMQAGHEMDALIAEKVMGWKWYEWHDEGWLCDPLHVSNPEFEMVNERKLDWADRVHTSRMMPHFSTDIGAAWQVVERLGELGFGVRVEAATMMEARVWKRFMNEHDPMPVWDRANTASLAICRAALKAVEAA